MKKLLLLISAAAISVSSMAAQNAGGVRFVNFGTRHLPEAVAASRAATIANISRAESQQLWRPANVREYNWGEDWENPGVEQWLLNSDRHFTYNAAGNPTSYTTEYELCEYTYDSEGRCIGMTTYDKINNTPYSKQEYTYDTVVKNLLVCTLTYFHQESGEWKLLNGEKTEITRNADDNITKIVDMWYSDYDNQGWVSSSMVEIGYGADKKANSIKQTYLGDGEPEVEAWFTDVVWERTNGQIVDFDTEESSFFMGENRLKSAKGLKQYTYPYVGDVFVNVVYKANDGGYKVISTINNEDYYWADYTVLDQYGSYNELEYEVDYDTMDDGTVERDEPSLDETTVQYDTFGLKLLELNLSYIDADKANGIDWSAEYKGTVTYDSTYGYPLEYIQTSKYTDSELRNNIRTVYADYYDVIAAGVDNIETSDNAPVEYYNLQGVRVTNPANGIFIRRQGATVTKVAL